MAYRQAALAPPVICLAATVVLILCFASSQPGAQRVGQGYTTPPSIAYGELYRDVELAAILPDSKTFPDMIPDAP
jgi:alpha,alpha-trehalase